MSTDLSWSDESVGSAVRCDNERDENMRTINLMESRFMVGGGTLHLRVSIPHTRSHDHTFALMYFYLGAKASQTIAMIGQLSLKTGSDFESFQILLYIFLDTETFPVPHKPFFPNLIACLCCSAGSQCSKGVGYYTQLVWQNTTHVGCGWSQFQYRGFPVIKCA